MLAVADKFASMTISASTPTGEMFVTIMEDDDGKPCHIMIHVGKSGSDATAWASSLSATINTALASGASINSIIEGLSQQTSGAPPKTNAGNVVISSGPEGVLYALLQYRKAKFREYMDMLNGPDDSEYRPARLDY